MTRKKTSKKRKTNKANRKNTLVLISMLLFITVAVGAKCYSIKPKIEQQNRVKAELEEQIKEEQARAKEIVELEKYVSSDAYIEDTAREKLGLAHENEIIFKAE
ncbi:MAG TPA: septum formation initiator family protein [Candidatus Dorea intestinavium]|nr:septum formation initiator family protein [Candidatus Dorea intestinavium]